MRGYDQSSGMKYIEFEINDVKYRAEMHDIISFSIDQVAADSFGAMTVDGALMSDPPSSFTFNVNLQVRNFTVTGDGMYQATSDAHQALTDDRRIKPPKNNE